MCFCTDLQIARKRFVLIPVIFFLEYCLSVKSKSIEMRRAVSTVEWNRFALLCFFGFLLVEKVHTNPTKENILLQEDLPEYYEHHFSGKS